MAAPDFVGDTTGASKGVDNAENGIKVESVENTMSNPILELLDKFGGPVGFAVSYDPRLNITVSGEIISTTGPTDLVNAIWDTPYGVQNVEGDAYTPSDSGPGQSWTGGAYLRDASVTANRETWKSTTATFQQIIGIA